MAERTYSFPAWRIALGIALILPLLLGTLVTLIIGPTPWWGYPLYPIVLALIWSTLFVMPKRRVTETEDGLRFFRAAGFSSRTVPWAEIERFEATAGGRMVSAISPKGAVFVIVGLDATTTTRWEGGETDDIVGELNMRLASWRRGV